MTMPPLFYLFFLVWIGCSQGELNNRPMFNNWYQKWINNSVVSPFLTAYTTLNKKIIEKITSINPNSDDNAIKSLINSLKCRFETVQKQLRRAVDATERIRTSLEREENTWLQKITRQEKLVRSKEKNVNETKINLEHAEHKMKLDELAMSNYQQSVNTAEHDVKMAQNAVDKSNKCRRRRRKKRFLYGLCGVFGWKGSKNAHDRLSLAVHNKHSVQHRFKFQQQILENQRFRLKTAESQLQSAITQLHTLESNLKQTKISYKHMATLAKEFKDVEIYLKEVLSSSAVFKDQLMNLIDFEHVIEPLNDIYQQMINNRLINFNTNKQSTEIIHPTSESLEKVKEIIKTWDIIIMDEDEISISCLLMEDD